MATMAFADKKDPKILFIVIRTRKAEAVQRALEASLGVKRYVQCIHTSAF